LILFLQSLSKETHLVIRYFESVEVADTTKGIKLGLTIDSTIEFDTLFVCSFDNGGKYCSFYYEQYIDDAITYSFNTKEMYFRGASKNSDNSGVVLYFTDSNGISSYTEI
jgi:hypothetical protein